METARAPLVAQIPNALTVALLVVHPVYVALMLEAEGGQSWPAALVFAALGVTDRLDGWLARRWQVESAFGKVADPLADRLMIDAAVVALWLHGRLPWPALAVILVRDVVLVGGYKLLEPKGYELDVNLLGKGATLVLYSAVALTLATEEGTDWPLWIFWVGLGLAVAAGIQYLVEARRKVGNSR